MEAIKSITSMEEPVIQSLEELNQYQIIRSEFVSPRLRPKLTFNFDSITFNSSCVALFKNTQYVQLLINSEEKRMIVMPCDEHVKDSLKWCNVKSGKKTPRNIGCKIFSAKLFGMMGWIPENRYKVQAIYQVIDGRELILFNLDEFEMVVPEIVLRSDGKKVRKAKAYYPEKWRESFGMTYREHIESYKIDFLDNYMVNNPRDGTESQYASSQMDGAEPTPAAIITNRYSR